MVKIQVKSIYIKEIVELLQNEVNKNPNGFINIEINSYDKPIPAISCSEDL
jgi:hypothetical protein